MVHPPYLCVSFCKTLMKVAVHLIPDRWDLKRNMLPKYFYICDHNVHVGISNSSICIIPLTTPAHLYTYMYTCSCKSNMYKKYTLASS